MMDSHFGRESFLELMKGLEKGGETRQEHIDYLYNGFSETCTGEICSNPLCYRCILSDRKRDLQMFIQKKILKTCGADPSFHLKYENLPVGLKNLGATCYMNTVLQCLYFTPSFKQHIYSVEVKENTLFQLQKMYASLQYGIRKDYDPKAFADSLTLTTGIQQDVQEFFLLFLSYLEGIDERLKKMVNELFLGVQVYENFCSVCNWKSEGVSNFQQLSVHLDGNSIEECMDQSFCKVEQLFDFPCPDCKNTSVGRRGKIKNLPTILNIHLMRFVYDPSLHAKYKVHKKISFGKTLDLSTVYEGGSPGEPDCLYTLYSVICHYGETANSGHYVAFVLEEGATTSSWNFFDDISVKKYSSFPFPLPAGTGTQLTPYILMYKKQQFKEDKSGAHTAPKELVESIQRESEQFLDDIKKFKFTSNLIKDKLEAGYLQYREVYANLAPVDEKFYWINAVWLKKWCRQEEPISEPINNSEILCEHDKLSFNLNKMKKISKLAWAYFVENYGGGPVFTKGSACRECALDFWDRAKALAGKFEIKASLTKACKKKPSIFKDNDLLHFYASREWILLWLKQPLETDTLFSKNFTEDLICMHEELTPNINLCVKVNQKCHDYLLSFYPNSRVFPAEKKPCHFCSSMKTNEERDLKKIAYSRNTEKDELWNAIHQIVNLKPGKKYYVIEKVWVLSWKKYLSNVYSNAEIINNNSLICTHRKLKYTIPKYQQPKKNYKFVVVDEEIWKKIIARHPCSQTISVQTVLHNLKEAKYEEILTEPELCDICPIDFEDSLISIHVVDKTSGKSTLLTYNPVILQDNNLDFLKTEIYKTLSVPKQNQELWMDGWCLDNFPNNTLKEHGIYKNSKIEVKWRDSSAPEIETGFSGSVLTGPKKHSIDKNIHHDTIVPKQIDNPQNQSRSSVQNPSQPKLFITGIKKSSPNIMNEEVKKTVAFMVDKDKPKTDVVEPPKKENVNESFINIEHKDHVTKAIPRTSQNFLKITDIKRAKLHNDQHSPRNPLESPRNVLQSPRNNLDYLDASKNTSQGFSKSRICVQNISLQKSLKPKPEYIQVEYYDPDPL